MDSKEMKRAESIIQGLEAEGMVYLGTVSRKTTPQEQNLVDEWDEQSRKKNGLVSMVYFREEIHCFFAANFYTGPRQSRAYARLDRKAVA